MQKSIRIYLGVAVILITIQLIIFKKFYPHPNLALDSYFYVKGAVTGVNNKVWPIGYSKFIRIFSFFSHSPLTFVVTQFVLLEISCLSFFLSWFFLFKPGKLVSNILFAALVVNPLFLFCSNFILSDALFISLSVGWITVLIWMLYSPRPWMVIVHAVLVLLAFAVRYNALYYPLIFILVFIISWFKLVYKIIGITLPLLLIWVFVGYSSRQVATAKGEPQFSPFGNWRLANNALYGYAHINHRTAPAPPMKLRVVDSVARQFFLRPHYPIEMSDPNFSGSFFLFDLGSPLIAYMGNEKNDISFLGSSRWISVSPLYQAYGSYLIRTYPMAFAEYFLWPNFQRYMIPPQDMAVTMSPFHFEESFGGIYVKQMFGITDISARPRSVLIRKFIVDLYPFLFAMTHACFLIGMIGFLLNRGFSRASRFVKQCIGVIVALWLFDMGFIVFSSGVWVRYMIFIMIIELSFGLYFLDITYKKIRDTSQ